MSADKDDCGSPKEFVQEIAYIAAENEDTTCVTCGAEFLDSEDLNLHVRQIHGGQNNCQFCDKTYTDLDCYSVHIRDYHLKELQCCHHCHKVFTDRLTAQSHKRRHYRKDLTVKCSQCTLYFDTKELRAHEFINHNNDHDGVFLKCMTHLSALLKLKAEVLLTTPNHTLTCFACGFTSFDLTIYMQHLNEENCSVVVCDRCDGLFKSKKNVMKHFMRKKKCFGIKDYSNMEKCPNCSNNVLKMLMAEHHKVCKAYSCGICRSVFKTIDELSRHQIMEHPSGLDIVKCQYCSKELAVLEQMKKHVERAHKPTMHLYKYMCKKCESIFKHPSKLFAHYFTRHKDFEPYTCRLCDKKFRLRKQFTIHIKLQHKGVGFVEFDDQYNVFFTEKQSEKPFIPKCVFPGYNPDENDHLKNDALEMDTDNEMEQEKTATKKPKRVRRCVNEIVALTSSDDEDTAPLLVIKKRAERKSFFKKVSKLSKKKKSTLRCKEFTCKVCRKYCYTYHNYHNHMKIHSKNELTECVKCLETFPNKKALAEHISTTHTTSKLIETLKTVLERKQGKTQNVFSTKTEHNNSSDDNHDIPNTSHSSERFLKTMKKVQIDKANVPATVKLCPNELSAKKFLENFSADINNTKDTKSDSVVITAYLSPYHRPHTIKLKKFIPDVTPHKAKLRMPTKFRADNYQNVNVTVKIIRNGTPKESIFEKQMLTSYEGDIYEDNDTYQEDDNEYKSDTIPEVAQEVMLEGSDEPIRQINMPKRKIVIPKLPVGYNDIHIATLHPEKPYYKIIKVKDVSNAPMVIDTSFKSEPKESTPTNVDEVIRLDNGTKLITANPLAHLLGDRGVEEVLQPVKNKHYKPIISDYKCKLVEALQKLDKPAAQKVKKRKAQ